MLIPRDPPIIPIVVFKRIRLLAVDRIVADPAHLVCHAQGHAADVFYEDHDEGGPDDVPADDEERAPNTERADGVGEGEPERDEDHPCCEVHSAEEGAGDENESDA